MGNMAFKVLNESRIIYGQTYRCIGQWILL